jgi:cytochrome c-type biogenesis protein CcmH
MVRPAHREPRVEQRNQLATVRPELVERLFQRFYYHFGLFCRFSERRIRRVFSFPLVGGRLGWGLNAKVLLRRITWLIVLSFSLATQAADPAIFKFDKPETEARFQALTHELRCLVCQNQSLADSHADLAGDLRREVYGMMQQGKTDKEIIEFLVLRYGDFVLYRPAVSGKTLALWLGPLLLLSLGGVWLVRAVRRHRQAPASELTLEQKERLAAFLKDEEA